MRIRPRPVASPPGRARGVFAGPAIGLPVSGGSMQTLRGGNRKRRFRAIGGKSGGKTESTSRKSRGNEIANSAFIWDYGFRNGRNEASRYERHVLITRRSSVRIRPPRPKSRGQPLYRLTFFASWDSNNWVLGHRWDTSCSGMYSKAGSLQV